jgi:DNA-directed RNA polymerase subunit RPC12/RpoP
MTHWKKLTNPNYLGSYSLENGEDMIVTIDYVAEELVIGPDGKKENCVVAHFTEGCKPMILNTTNLKTIAKIYKTPYVENWHGKKIQLYSASVKAFGETVDALRIREYVPKETEYRCADCGMIIKPYGKMSAAAVAQGTMKKYGEYLCAECGAERKNKKGAEEAASDVLAGVKDDND